MQGYHGRLLEVDLSNQTTRDLSISEDFCKNYIGGATMAAALIFQRSGGLRPATGSGGDGDRAFYRFIHTHGKSICSGRNFAAHRVLG